MPLIFDEINKKYINILNILLLFNLVILFNIFKLKIKKYFIFSMGIGDWGLGIGD